MFLIASHLNGTRVYIDIEKKKITLKVPEAILYQDTLDFLENGRSLAISKSNFFNSYVGIATTITNARAKLKEVLVRVLSEFAAENVLLQYLSQELSFSILPLLPAIETNDTYTISLEEKTSWTPHEL